MNIFVSIKNRVEFSQNSNILSSLQQEKARFSIWITDDGTWKHEIVESEKEFLQINFALVSFVKLTYFNFMHLLKAQGSILLIKEGIVAFCKSLLARIRIS